MELEREREYFESHRDELVAGHEGQFVLVHGQDLIGVYPDAEQAYAEGLARFGAKPFLVKQVLKEEPVAYAPLLSLVPTRGRL